MSRRLPIIFLGISLFFLAAAAIMSWTSWQRREEVEIISKGKRFSVGEGHRPSPGPADGGTNIRENPLEIRVNPEDGEDVLGESEEEIGKLSVNDATLEELDTVPGIGPKTAEKIINGRPWSNLEDALALINKRWREEARVILKL